MSEVPRYRVWDASHGGFPCPTRRRDPGWLRDREMVSLLDVSDSTWMGLGHVLGWISLPGRGTGVAVSVTRGWFGG